MEHEAAAAGHEAGSGFPPFDQIADFGVSQIFWLVVTFAVLYVAVAFVFLPKIRASLESRDSAIKSDVAKAAALSAKADESVKQVEAQIAEARARSRDTASKAKAEARRKDCASYRRERGRAQCSPRRGGSAYLREPHESHGQRCCCC